jgi:DNA-binding CsgD family transcriptional regulator
MYRTESANLARALGDRFTLAMALAGLALLARQGGELDKSRALFKESLQASAELGDLFVLPRALAGLAGVAHLSGDYVGATRLYGAAASLREQHASIEHAPWRELFQSELDEVRTALGNTVFESTWAEGHTMTLAAAVSYALGLGDSSVGLTPEIVAVEHRIGGRAPAPHAAARSPASGTLTIRERQIAELIASGLSNRGIADALVITEGTVEVHVKHVLGKLGFRSRSQVAAWAANQQP